ncbi:transaldolase [Staphylococcus chromogenes]|nr:transaldolase [Staphylococcus chromogenes]
MSSLSSLKSAGTSTWLDDLSRDRLDSGNLAELIEDAGILGVTTNPSIFQAAMTAGTRYDGQLAELREAKANADDAVYQMAIADVQRACDAFADVHERTNGLDGWVSIEVDPRIAHDADATLAQAKSLVERVARDNVMIKIPATVEALPAISDALAAGISVNVTLIFSEVRYRAVMDAYVAGIRRAAAAGLDVSRIHSVASFFISRVDAEIDKRLAALGSEEAKELQGKAAIANARLAYAAFREVFDHAELPDGANIQRPLWASTSVKNPDYPATLYVDELAGPHTVNTMPESTLNAVLAGNGEFSDRLSGLDAAARDVFAQLDHVGIDLGDVFEQLEREGVEKFEISWSDLLQSIAGKLN